MAEENDFEASTPRDVTPTQTLRDRLRLLREKGRAETTPLQSLSLAPSIAGSDANDAAELLASNAQDASHGIGSDAQQPEFGDPDGSHHHHPIVSAAEAEQQQQQQEQPVFVSPQDLQLYHAPEPTTVDPSEVFNRPEPEIHLPSQMNDTADMPVVSREQHNEDAVSDSEDAKVQADRINLGEYEFAVPLPMDSRIRDEYDSLIEKNRSPIAVFMKKTDPTLLEEDNNNNTNDDGGDTEKSRLTQQMITLIDRLNNICTHPDLNRPLTAINQNPAAETKWAEYQSSKFEFLGRLIVAAATEAMHIVIFSKPGKPMHLLETYFLGRNFIRNPSAEADAPPQETSFSKIDLSFGIRSTADETMRVPFQPPSLIIALDATFDAKNPAVYSLRSTYAETEGQLVPVVRLIIAKSSEHIERCLPSGGGMEALRFLVQRTEELSEAYSPYSQTYDFHSDDAERVIEFAKFPPSLRRWPLPVMSFPEEWIRAEEEEEEGDDQDHGIRSTLTIGGKRPLVSEDDPETSPAKRRKVASSWHEIVRMSGTKKKSPSRLSRVRGTLAGEHAAAADPDTIIQQLRSELAENRSFLTKYQTEFAKLQHRYETKHNRYHKMRQSLDKSLESNKRLDHEMQRLKQDNAVLRDERASLRNDLEELRDSKKSESQIQSDLIEAKEEAAKLQKENASLKRQNDQERSQAEYTRIQYQNASSAAAQAVQENKQLEEKITSLQEQVSRRALELKQMRTNNNEQIHLARIAELEAALNSREWMLTLREEELRELKKNRPSTRATSIQPR
ncbi:hypothetical protein KEM56_003795, partial [Ascosphaera pollenicola]